MDADEIARFRKLIVDYYLENGRDFPWRHTRDPWLILVSEMMLQQTQTGRVAAKWDAFTAAFPDPASMARAPLADVVRLWSGLGYNRRALALKQISGICAGRGNRLPDSFDELLELPMVGPYTARALLAFAWNRPVVLIETNIRRVFLHHFFPEERDVPDSAVLPLIEESLDREHPREWYYALMDYGSELPRKVSNPNRRSAHYSRQAPFQGSNRQKRGALLRALAGPGSPPRTIDDLSLSLGEKPETVKPLLESLVREGFAAENGGLYSIAR